MTEIEKKIYIKEKLNNFILFVQQTFGQDNILIKEFGDAIDIDRVGFEPMIKGLLRISNIMSLPMDTENKKKENMRLMQIFLDFKQLKTTEENMFKILRYLDLFYKVF